LTFVGLTNSCSAALHLSCAFNEIADNCCYRSPNQRGLGDNTMPRRPIVAATMIVAAGLIGITQARLPRPIRGYRDRVDVEISACDALSVGTLIR
jgi:hypothetical protein